jgi:hypothetical protein
MNLQNRNTFQSLQNNQNSNNQSLANQNMNNMNSQSMNNSVQSAAYNQTQLQNESNLAALGYNPQQDLEMAAELNQKTPGEISRILASKSMTGIEFGYLPNPARMNNANNMNGMNNLNNMNNSSNLNNVNNLNNNMR